MLGRCCFLRAISLVARSILIVRRSLRAEFAFAMKGTMCTDGYMANTSFIVICGIVGQLDGERHELLTAECAVGVAATVFFRGEILVRAMG